MDNIKLFLYANHCLFSYYMLFNPLSAKFIKWSNTLKQIVGKLPTICLSVFDHFSGLALKGLKAMGICTEGFQTKGNFLHEVRCLEKHL